MANKKKQNDAQEPLTEETKVEEVKEEVKEEVMVTVEENQDNALEVVETVEEPKPSKSEKKANKKAERENKRKFGNVMSTGAFIRMLVLLLIPGVNVLLIIFWALGASKNRNKINLSRGLIVFFLIEVLLTLIIFGIGYIYIDRKEAFVLKYADKYTNGVLTYFDIDSYEDLAKLKDISSYLVEKTTEEEDEEVVIPKTCYIYNPVGIESYDEFMALYNAQFNLNDDVAEPIIDPETGADLSTEEDKAATLFDILENNNVDTEESELIYIIIDNETENSVIVFDPTGEFQTYPSIQVNGEYVYVGGAK